MFCRVACHNVELLNVSDLIACCQGPPTGRARILNGPVNRVIDKVPACVTSCKSGECTTLNNNAPLQKRTITILSRNIRDTLRDELISGLEQQMS